MEDTMTKPLTSADVTRIQTELAIKKAFHINDDPNDTSNTSTNGPDGVYPKPTILYNRKVWRYAKAHKISPEAAFKRLYK